MMRVLQTLALPLGYAAAKKQPAEMGCRGAGDGIRTRDILLGKEVLYH